MLAINTYKMVQHLKNAGMNEAQAVVIQETVVSMREADIEKLATKDDLRIIKDELRATKDELNQNINVVKVEMQEIKTELQGEIRELKTELKTQVQRIDNEFKLVRAESKAEHEKTREDFQKTLLTAVVMIIGVILASAKFIK